MNNTKAPKIAIDPELDKEKPMVYVSSVPSEEEKTLPKSKKPTNLPVYFAKRLITLFFDFLETGVVALSIFVVAYLFLIQPHEIKGNSMEPNFHNNEYILTDKISYRLKEPQRGDVIIFKAPKNPDIDYIKRIIALPGEKIKIENGLVYINGKILEELYINEATNLFPGSFIQKGIETTIPPDEYFAMGDNRTHSSDSREFGPIPKPLIIGRALLRYWPIPQLGMLEKINY